MGVSLQSEQLPPSVDLGLEVPDLAQALLALSKKS